MPPFSRQTWQHIAYQAAFPLEYSAFWLFLSLDFTILVAAPQTFAPAFDLIPGLLSFPLALAYLLCGGGLLYAGSCAYTFLHGDGRRSLLVYLPGLLLPLLGFLLGWQWIVLIPYSPLLALRILHWLGNGTRLVQD